MEILILYIRILSEAHQHRLSHLSKVVFTAVRLLLFLFFESTKGWSLTLKSKSIIEVEGSVINICFLSS
jgi:hypothetical protein